MQSKVRLAEEKVERYKRDNKIVMTGGSPFSDQELAQLNQQLALVSTQAAQAQARAEQVERVLRAGGSPDAINEAIQSQTIGQLRIRLSLAEQQAVALAVDLKPSHPAMAAARAKVADARAQIRAELDRIASAARSDLERSRASERQLAAALDQAKRQQSATDQARVQLRELERDADASRTVYETFLKRARELGEQKGVDPTNVRVISPAVPPADPKGLKLSLLLPLALFAGLGLGSGLALAREGLDPVVHTSAHAAEAVGQPVLTQMPVYRPRATAVPAIVVDQPESPAATAMRRLRAALGSTAAGASRSVLITAVGAENAKSVVALNLALAAAEGGERVLLVDGDPIRHRLTTTVAKGAGNGDGLAGVLQDRTSLEDAVVIDASGLIRLLPAPRFGQTPARPGIPSIGRLLRDKCKTYDLVVIDGGVIGLDNLTNVFAAVVDDIVLVAQSGATRKDDLATAMSKLGPQMEKVRGVALAIG